LWDDALRDGGEKGEEAHGAATRKGSSQIGTAKVKGGRGGLGGNKEKESIR